mgnify:CR=1 FL=1
MKRDKHLDRAISKFICESSYALSMTVEEIEEIPARLRHCIDELVATFKEVTMQAQTKNGIRGTDTRRTLGERRNAVIEAAEELQSEISAAVKASLSAVDRLGNAESQERTVFTQK